jgi:hypothetical protein
MKKIQLNIPNPCHENWEAMTPQEKGRFCGSCQKTVVDFSTMSDRQIAEFFKKPPSSVCGRFVADQLDRDIALPKKRIPWIKYFFQFSLPAFLFSTKAMAQGKVAVKGDLICVSAAEIDTSKKRPDEGKILIEGKIEDATGAHVPFAHIQIPGTREGTRADENGAFKISVKPGSYLQITAVGFTPQTLKVDSFSNLRVKMVVLESMMSGEVLIVKKSSKKKDPMPLIKKITDTAFKNFSIYPNPARNNSYLKLDLSKLEKGEYIVSVIAMNGDILQNEEHKTGEKKKIVDFYLRDISAGTYVVHLFNIKTAASFSEKIIIQ